MSAVVKRPREPGSNWASAPDAPYLRLIVYDYSFIQSLSRRFNANSIRRLYTGLFDALYLSARRCRQLRRFPKLSWSTTFSRRALREWIATIDETRSHATITERWGALSKTQS
jgi:hypothetical protein